MIERFIRCIEKGGQRVVGLLRRSIRLRFLPARRIFTMLAILALMFLCCMSGAAVMHFDVGPALFLRNCFEGFRAWEQHGKSQSFVDSSSETRLGVTRDDPDKTFDGFTLVTSTQGTDARLIDMRGNVVHRWNLPFSRAWPHPSHVKHPVSDDQVHWFRCHLFADGNLLAVYQADGDTPHGYGLAKLDKDSQLLWTYSGNVHHDLDVDEEGRVYVLVHEIARERPAGLDAVVPPYLADYLVVLSPQGRELEKIPILEAFRDTPFSLMLASIESGSLRERDSAKSPSPIVSGVPSPAQQPQIIRKQLPIGTPPMAGESGDVLHANGVRVLKRSFATKFPLFKPGQALISVRSIDAIAMLDIPTRSIVWAARGIWRAQHDPEFLENGHLLLYDNSGYLRGSRVIEYDPLSYGYPWSYSNEHSLNFIASARGMKQRLPNGNVLIVDPDGGRIFEVTHEKEVVWEYGCSADFVESDNSQLRHCTVTGAIRYSSDYLMLLKGTVPVRP